MASESLIIADSLWKLRESDLIQSSLQEGRQAGVGESEKGLLSACKGVKKFRAVVGEMIERWE